MPVVFDLTRKAVLALACGLAILPAAACHSPSAPAPTAEAPPPDEAETQTEAARHLTPDQVATLEAAAAKDPKDIDSRARLLIFYARGNYPAETRRIMLWMIHEHPEGIQVWGTKKFTPIIDASLDPDGYAQGKKLWLPRLVKHHVPTPVLNSAANYFKLADGVIAQKLLFRASVDDDEVANAISGDCYEGLANPPSNKPAPLRQ